MACQIAILAGGLGTRIRSLLPDAPKAMAQVGGRPFLEYPLSFLKRGGIRNVVICVGYLRDQIMKHFGDGSSLDLEITYSIEEHPLGTGGAIKHALPLLEEDFFALNGDTIFDVDLGALRQFHRDVGGSVTIALTRVQEASRYGSVAIDDRSRVIAFTEKNELSPLSLYVNGGLYHFTKGAIDWSSLPEVFSLERDLFPLLVSRREVVGFKTDGFFIDIGIPQDLLRLRESVLRGGEKS